MYNCAQQHGLYEREKLAITCLCFNCYILGGDLETKSTLTSVAVMKYSCRCNVGDLPQLTFLG